MVGRGAARTMGKTKTTKGLEGTSGCSELKLTERFESLGWRLADCVPLMQAEEQSAYTDLSPDQWLSY